MGVLSLISQPESPFQAPSLVYQAITTPVHLALSFIHSCLVGIRGHAIPSPREAIRIVCISDTHTNTPSLPVGDVLIHAGDLTNSGTVSDIQAQVDWLSALPYKYIIAIAGNHDSFFDPKSRSLSDRGKAIDFKNIHYLQHSSITLDFRLKNNRKLILFGAPQIPACGGDEMAFQYQRQEDAWTGTVPPDVDVLITHTPPRWHLDLPIGMGCDHLLKEVWRVRPQLHVFGHVHAGRGKERVYWDGAQKAYERLAPRKSIFSLISPTFWLDVARVLVYNVIGIVWTRIWGAELEGTIMVNSALVDYYGKLRHNGQMVEI
ncbi:MAG: hypothetical protein LQ340_004472 [Diploschistes diacapsis]|nr:MAG: hypothetical protein LQ340_004472 [Diploschistes diacapsis]